MSKKKIRVFKTVEKRTDVNIAVHMLNDAWENKYDTAVVVSNDSDLIGSIELVKNQQKREVILMIPGGSRASTDLSKVVNYITRIRTSDLKKHEFHQD